MSTKRTTILLTGGRAPAALELARLFAAEGCRVLVADSVSMALCRYSRSVDAYRRIPGARTSPGKFVEALLEMVREERVDLLVPTCEEIFTVAAARNRLERYCRVWTDSLDTLRRLHSKWAFQMWCRHLGRQLALPEVQLPRTRLLRGEADLHAFLASEAGAQPFVLKPVYSRFGMRALPVMRPHEDASRHLTGGRLASLSPASPWVAQAYVPGTLYCTYSVADRGRLLAHAGYEPPLGAERGASVCFIPAADAAAEAWVRRFVAASRFTGQIAFDFIRTPAGVLAPIECNPRATSGVHLFEPADGLPRSFGVGGAEPAALQPTIRPARQRPAMLALPMLTRLPAALARPAYARPWRTAWRSARDAVWRANDPAPAFTQIGLFAEMAVRALRRGVSLEGAMTADLEWNGEPINWQGAGREGGTGLDGANGQTAEKVIGTAPSGAESRPRSGKEARTE